MSFLLAGGGRCSSSQRDLFKSPPLIFPPLWHLSHIWSHGGNIKVGDLKKCRCERSDRSTGFRATTQKARSTKNWTKSKEKRPKAAAPSGRPTPVRFCCAGAKPDDSWKTNPCGRGPTQPLQHRHPNIAGRATCSTGHARKGDRPLYNPEFSV